MKLKIENLKKSGRGIEVSGYVPTPDCESVPTPDIPYGLVDEDRERLVVSYFTSRKEANKEHDAEKREYERLHLGDAELVQEK